MVFFTCSNCNASLKKNKVEIHCNTQCRNAEFVSCVDCSTDFYGDDYLTHTTCISEAEKYGGKDYAEKTYANKGQKKQDLWLEKVQAVLDNAQTDDPRVKDILENLSAYPNIPQKKVKFINFLKNSFPRYKYNEDVLHKVWNMLEAAKTDQTAENGEPKAAEAAPVANGKVNGSDKQRRRKQKESIGETLEVSDTSETVSGDKDKKKKKKKKKRGDDEEELDEAEVAAMRENKWKKRDPEMEDIERLNDTLQEVEKQPRDFNIGRLITEVLERKGTISVKNLRKKALAEYYECGISNMTEDKVLSKLDRKLRSMDNVKVVNEKVSFVEDDE